MASDFVPRLQNEKGNLPVACMGDDGTLCFKFEWKIMECVPYVNREFGTQEKIVDEVEVRLDERNSKV